MKRLILACLLTWTHPGVDVERDHFRVYVSAERDAPTVASEEDPIEFISASGPFEWQIDLPSGQWYIKVTRWDSDNDRESVASREVFVVIDGTSCEESKAAPGELAVKQEH